MQKLRVDEPTIPGHCQRLLMFRELCLHSRVDSGVFSRVARRYGILAIRPGPPAGGAGHLDVDAGASMDALAPLYTAALRSISSQLPDLDQRGLGRGIERKWEICGVTTLLMSYNDPARLALHFRLPSSVPLSSLVFHSLSLYTFELS